MYFDPIETGKRLKALRVSRGLTQEKMAEKLNICCEHYGRIELGKKVCSIDLLCEIKVFFNTTTDYLLFGEGEAIVFTPEMYDVLVSELKNKLFNQT